MPRSNRMVTSDRAVQTAVNRRVLRVVRDLDDGEQEWEFFCECGREDCHEHVFFTLDAFMALRDHGGVVLADAHRPSQVVRARGLRTEAAAVRRQAVQQVKRVMKIT